jgi:hypothetical protein
MPMPASLLLLAFLLLMASLRVGGPAVACVPAVVGDHVIDVILAVGFVTAAACVEIFLAHALYS